MNARLLSITLAAFVALGANATAQTTVTGPGGATTLPPNGSLATPLPVTGDPDSGNVFTASPKAGPQAHLGHVNNVTVHYIVGDYIAPPIVYNAAAPGVKGNNYRNYAGRFAFEVPLGDNFSVYIGGEARKYTYQTPGALYTGLGTAGRVFLPATTAVDYDEDVRAGVRLIGPRIFLAVSGLRRGNSLGENNERGLGYGLEKLADVDQNFSLHGSVFYYPNVGGSYGAGGASSGGDVSYKVIRYLAGATISPKGSPLFLDAGYLGDYAKPRTDAPVGFRHQGPFVGVGIHF